MWHHMELIQQSLFSMHRMLKTCQDVSHVQYMTYVSYKTIFGACVS